MKIRKLTTPQTLSSVILALLILALPLGGADATNTAAPVQFSGAQVVTLQECLKTAMENNRRRPASGYALSLAEAQHRQALSGYWPQIGLRGGYQIVDQSPNFIFPSSAVIVPAQTLSLPNGGSIPITFPTPGGPMTVPVNAIPIPEQGIEVPMQDIKLADRESFAASLHAQWLLYDGGMRRGYREQGQGAIKAAKAEVRRTDLEINDSVTRMFYGAVLARQLHQLGKDTLARMEATLNLTETMYKEGSGTVKKTDYLDNKVMVETIRATVAALEKNELMSQAALANTMGLNWQTSVSPAAEEIPHHTVTANINELVGTAYQFNPDWEKLDAGLLAYEGALRTARSGYSPKLAVTGDVHKLWNDYDAGMATERNKEGWTVGVGVEVPLFTGFLTKSKVAEARARLAKLREEQLLLKEGIGLMVKDTLLSLNASQKSFAATFDAMTSAAENRDLNTRAYQNELVETGDVIRAQLFEALMTAQHLKIRFDSVALQSQLNTIVGTEVQRQLHL